MNSYRRTVLYPLLVLLLFSAALSAQVKKLDDSPQGKIAQAYLDAFNAADESKMKAFLEANVPPEALKERPVEQRLERYRTMKTDIRSITLMDVLAMSADEVVVTAKNGAGEMITLSFAFTPTTPPKFSGLKIDLGVQAPASSGPPLAKTAALDSMKAAIQAAVAADRFSGTVLVARDSAVLFEHAYGSAEKRWKTPNTIETKFNLGSINKFFTRLAIGQLAEAGKLSLDDTLIKILPDYPNRAVARKVTVQQLIDMSSGMGDFFGEKFVETPKDGIRALADYLKLFVNDPLEFEPGTRKRYSNAGYIVLGLIVEKLSEEDYYSYVRKHVFLPAGMTNTDSYMMDGITPGLATGYQHPEGSETAWESNMYTAPARGSSAGGGYSTVRDLFRFLRALRSGKLLSARSSAWMLSGNYPPGTPELPLKSGSIGIAGGAPGINAAIEFDAASGNTVVVLANYSPPAATDVAKLLRGFLERVKE
jgi:D-alanyl-D-alanine carboxypeptidase